MSSPGGVKLPTPEELGLVTPAEPPRESDIYRSMWKIRKMMGKLIASTILVVDPSIGSERSQPGYALFRGGELVDFGTLQVGESGARNLRLAELRRCLMEDFADTQIDVLVVEDIPAARVMKYNGRVFKNHKAHIPLHRAVGAVQCSVPAPISLEVAPQTWHRFVDDERYVKSDAHDAVAMGWTVLQIATYIMRNPERGPLKKEKRRRRRGPAKVS